MNLNLYVFILDVLTILERADIIKLYLCANKNNRKSIKPNALY